MDSKIPTVELRFKVNPIQLQNHTYVFDPVEIRITKPSRVGELGILGESGQRMAEAGFQFIFTRAVAEELIGYGYAEKV
jgi:hypothetical protein